MAKKMSKMEAVILTTEMEAENARSALHADAAVLRDAAVRIIKALDGGDDSPSTAQISAYSDSVLHTSTRLMGINGKLSMLRMLNDTK